MDTATAVSKRQTALLAYVLLMALPIFAALAISSYAGAFGWDDGAITLAFGRTLFETGDFALNASSSRVEGSSTLLFAVLNGALITGLDLDFYEAIVGSRLLSALFHGGTSCLLIVILRNYLPIAQAVMAAFLYCLLPIHYAEIFNGMEMTAFAFLLCLYFYALSCRSRAAFLILPPLLLVRIEAGFYLLVVLSFAPWMADTETRTRLLKHLAATVMILVALQVFRVLYFGSFFPNTVLAKMHEPYSFSGNRAYELKILGFLDYLKLYFIPIIAMSVLLYLSASRAAVREVYLLVLAFGLFALLSGRNWGYDARMSLALLAPAVVGVAAATRSLERGRATSTLPFSLVLATLAGHTFGSVGSSAMFVHSLRTGAEMTHLLENDVSNRNPRDPYAYGFYGVTPENYRLTGEAVERLADLLELPTIKFAVPDVGGLSLCCDRIAVLDTALLTNPVLAKEGYAAFDEYLEDTEPDVIETHEVWSVVTRIYDSPDFKAHYVPVVFRNTFLFLRRSHADALVARGRGTYAQFDSKDFHTVRYGVDVTSGLYPGKDGAFLNLD